MESAAELLYRIMKREMVTETILLCTNATEMR